MNRISKLSCLLSLVIISGSVFAGVGGPTPTPTPTPALAQVPATGESNAIPGSSKGVAWPSPRFVVGTGAKANCITDKLTGLMWPKNGIIGFSNGTSPFTPLATPELNNTIEAHNKLKWSISATNVIFIAIANLNSEKLCGKSDWRLPNKVELKSLLNYGQASSATWLNTQGFSNIQSYFYWSSSTDASPTTNVWTVLFSSGGVTSNSKTSDYYVLPVRGGQ